MNSKSIELFGCKIDALNMKETLSLVEEIIRDRVPHQHVVVNVAKIVNMQTDHELREIINSCDVVNADGMPVVWASRILGKPLPCRVAGIDLFQSLVALCSDKGYRPFFFGAREEVVKKMVEIFKIKYPSLNIAGYRNGYFAPGEEEEIAGMIRDSHADIVFVGFSTPMKERFLNQWMEIMQVPFCMGVGGSFDIIAGKTKRAPKWMQESGLEWLCRLVQEPRRMWWRYTSTNPAFILMVLKEYVRMPKLKSDTSKNIDSPNTSINKSF